MTPVDNGGDMLAALLHLLLTGDGEHLRLYVVMLTLSATAPIAAAAHMMLRILP